MPIVLFLFGVLGLYALAKGGGAAPSGLALLALPKPSQTEISLMTRLLASVNELLPDDYREGIKLSVKYPVAFPHEKLFREKLFWLWNLRE